MRRDMIFPIFGSHEFTDFASNQLAGVIAEDLSGHPIGRNDCTVHFEYAHADCGRLIGLAEAFLAQFQFAGGNRKLLFSSHAPKVDQQQHTKGYKPEPENEE